MSGLGLADRALDHVQLRRAPGRPNQVHLAVTDRCFLPCVHCDIWKNTTPDLSGAIWAEVIDRLSGWCSPAGMNFVGGEPLIRKDLETLMARAVRGGFQVSFNTNGWLVSEKRARQIADAGTAIAYVSLDGMTEETVDATRGRAGSFDKAMAAIDLLDAQPNPRVVIACILHGQNAHEIPALIDFVRRRELQLVVQPLYQNFGDNTYDPDWWRTSPLWPADASAMTAIDHAVEALCLERVRGGSVCNAVAQIQAIGEHFRNPGIDNGHTCRAGHGDISFDAHGNIRMCYFLDPVATVFDRTPLPGIWDGLHALRRRWQVSRCPRNCNLLNCNFERNDI